MWWIIYISTPRNSQTFGQIKSFLNLNVSNCLHTALVTEYTILTFNSILRMGCASFPFLVTFTWRKTWEISHKYFLLIWTLKMLGRKSLLRTINKLCPKIQSFFNGNYVWYILISYAYSIKISVAHPNLASIAWPLYIRIRWHLLTVLVGYKKSLTSSQITDGLFKPLLWFMMVVLHKYFKQRNQKIKIPVLLLPMRT